MGGEGLWKEALWSRRDGIAPGDGGQGALAPWGCISIHFPALSEPLGQAGRPPGKVQRGPRRRGSCPRVPCWGASDHSKADLFLLQDALSAAAAIISDCLPPSPGGKGDRQAGSLGVQLDSQPGLPSLCMAQAAPSQCINACVIPG